MSRYIDADALYNRLFFKWKSDRTGSKERGLRCAMAQLQKATTADVVEVVRCKDCKHRIEDAKICEHPRAMGWDAIKPEDDDFCSCGERKEGDSGGI